MCERCRGKHRVYAVTKRAKRKMEKAAILEEATGIPAEPLPTQNKAKPVAESQSLQETQPSQLNYWDSAMLDPQPLPAQSSFSSSSALAGALGPMHFSPAGNSPSPVNDADPATRRCCSVKGCKTLISRRCVSRAEIGIAGYGVTKRKKWKAERLAFDKELEALQLHEDERRRKEGITVSIFSIIKRITSLGTFYRRRKSCLPPSFVEMLDATSVDAFESDLADSDSLNTTEADTGETSNALLDDSLPLSFNKRTMVMPSNAMIVSSTASVQPVESSSSSTSAIPGPSSAFLSLLNNPTLSLPQRMCTVSHCHTILPGTYLYKRCEKHRAQNRMHGKIRMERERLGLIPGKGWNHTSSGEQGQQQQQDSERNEVDEEEGDADAGENDGRGDAATADDNIPLEEISDIERKARQQASILMAAKIAADDRREKQKARNRKREAKLKKTAAEQEGKGKENRILILPLEAG
ncbi:hypothetical protein BT96DRAFT_931775 [Gymnopus androsaceus JB14]|uniref:Uncharacterized protein n=1 Tax=Gymnopus androsaceus JB14 TaxID=1447944 RepID=A0A6A4IL85_9AGAR|nr:hypothetical protein BT96DRAFT_931775 [Gymnopus androsaceus JB14]